MANPELIASGIAVPEGPTWCPDGTLVVTAVAEAALYRIWPEERRKERIAVTKGGPNSTALASDGGFLVTQNGGIDFRTQPRLPGTGLDDFVMPEPHFVEPGLQRVAPDGTVTRLIGGMQAPNDLAIGPDGTVWFTDPHGFPAPPGPPKARVMALAPDGTMRQVASGLVMVNGIALEPEGNLIVTEGNGLLRLSPEGEREWIVENISENHATDGIKLDVDGRIWMAASLDRGVRIMEESKEVGFIPLPGEGFVTNLCFGGEDLRTLFVTDGPGNVWMIQDVEVAGQPLHPWPVRDGDVE